MRLLRRKGGARLHRQGHAAIQLTMKDEHAAGHEAAADAAVAAAAAKLEAAQQVATLCILVDYR
jgi:hypothetical protein